MSQVNEAEFRSNRPMHSVAAIPNCKVPGCSGQFKGQEGVCLGKGSADNLWAVSPDSTNEVLSLVFEKDFGLLVDLSADPNQN
jgi:hypothetical protein